MTYVQRMLEHMSTESYPGEHALKKGELSLATLAKMAELAEEEVELGTEYNDKASERVDALGNGEYIHSHRDRGIGVMLRSTHHVDRAAYVKAETMDLRAEIAYMRINDAAASEEVKARRRRFNAEYRAYMPLPGFREILENLADVDTETALEKYDEWYGRHLVARAAE
jgi:hypothetical protein